MDLKSHLHFLTDGKAKALTSTPGSSKAASVPFQGKVCHDKRPIEQFSESECYLRGTDNFQEQICEHICKVERGYCVTVVLLFFKYFSQFQIREYHSDITGTQF